MAGIALAQGCSAALPAIRSHDMVIGGWSPGLITGPQPAAPPFIDWWASEAKQKLCGRPQASQGSCWTNSSSKPFMRPEGNI